MSAVPNVRVRIYYFADRRDCDDRAHQFSVVPFITTSHVIAPAQANGVVQASVRISVFQTPGRYKKHRFQS